MVGVEGSQFSHAIYTVADNGAFLVLQPPDRFSMAYKEYTDRVGLTYAFVVGTPDEDGFRVETDRLQRMLDRLL